MNNNKKRREIKSKSSRLGSEIKRIKIVPPNRSGFELAISTLVLLILGIVVLIALILFFTGGFKKFNDTIQNFFVSDVEAVKTACKSACGGNLEYDFCCRDREANFGAGKEKITCSDGRLKVECEINCENIC